MTEAIEVLIVGAGASGLTLAIDLQRRGVNYRIIELAAQGFEGSRAKGVQPRTLEVFDDLGALDRLESRAMLYPPLRIHLGPLKLKRTMFKHHEPTTDTPHANTLLAPQYATDASLRERLEELGGHIEYGTRLESYTQNEQRVTAQTSRSDGSQETIHSRFLIGADGGSSSVRRGAGIRFEGSTNEADRMIVADLNLRGLSRDRWHVWPKLKGRFVALCPLPDGRFQLMLKLREDDPTSFDSAAVKDLASTVLRSTKVEVDEVLWSSVWRPNIRLAERYKSGNVFLVGDAAHVHPPTGAQGLNTGVQDAYNLGWKLGQVLAGAPDLLLDTYEAERQPVAARVLGLATGLYSHLSDKPLEATKRGDEERQLLLNYRGGPLAPEVDDQDAGVQAGDRAPDAPIFGLDSQCASLFSAFRGPHFTLITIGDQANAQARALVPNAAGAEVKLITLDPKGNSDFRDIYGIDEEAVLLVRPDGYIASVQRSPLSQLQKLSTLPLFPSQANS